MSGKAKGDIHERKLLEVYRNGLSSKKHDIQSPNESVISGIAREIAIETLQPVRDMIKKVFAETIQVSAEFLLSVF
jgi:hypothetical protein